LGSDAKTTARNWLRLKKWQIECPAVMPSDNKVRVPGWVAAVCMVFSLVEKSLR